MQLLLDGPYGAPQIDVYSERYKCFVIVATGGAWPFLRSWKRQLLHDRARGRDVRSIVCIAAVPQSDAHVVSEFAGWDVARSGKDSKDDAAQATDGLHVQVCRMTSFAWTMRPSWHCMFL